MLITYCLTVRLLARQQQSLCLGGGGGGGGGNGTGGSTAGGVSTTNGNQPNGWGSGWLGQQTNIGKLLHCYYLTHGTLFNHQFILLFEVIERRANDNILDDRRNRCARLVCVGTFSVWFLITSIICIVYTHTDRRCTWRRLLKTSLPSTPNHPHSANSTDTELSNLDTHELWLPDSR